MQSDGFNRLSSQRTRSPTDNTSRSRIALIVPKTLVKKIKNALEAHGNLDKKVKIRPARLEEQRAYLEEVSIEPRLDAIFIPTKVSRRIEQAGLHALPVRWDLLQSLGLVEFEVDIGMIALKQDTHGFLDSDKDCEDGPRSHEAFASETGFMNPLARTIDHWLYQLPHEKAEQYFARDVVLKFRTSHIALNAPILASASKRTSVQGGGHPETNILRSPTGLAPVYGDFGPDLSMDHAPTITDFSAAFWCTAQQNGIFQTWAPRYTMFSRGNISEKVRILSLKTLTKKQLRSQPEETSAVDLFAGIGYFAFSYAKVGVGKVLCWEINPWSVEGLRRGAKRNGWGIKYIKDGQAPNETINEEDRLIVFQESNAHATRRIAAVKDSIPPVRHVNCGLLPSSKDSWEVAVQVLDPAGGWIHVHENIAKKDIEGRREEIVGIFSRLVMNHCVHESQEQWRVDCEHVEQVKSYAPGVMHYVLDISISPPG
ncbi:MAG: hypothetical protein Q9161_001412 [Pseudevernia consocians]